ncbi:VWA domain-containing protein [Halomonas sp. DP8Y7-3]|uniref:VWA domain-containing protein n=1 Tax=Halomonas sp. DP8Y7-3 TaxID=2859079 RepID=UPI001C96B6E6|nr:vWA domain-containing protein [Halomonas sp. DP8Y7-3]MBY5930660.1 VWA domain-containing protein [Halomonas sp. DP8Y7-3]
MKKPNPSMSVLVAGLVAGAMAFTLASSVMAQDVGDDAWTEQPPDVRVIVDVSGSMKTNDPNKLAGSALDMLVALLPGGVNAGIWTFGQSVDNPLPPARVDAQWRERALALPPALEQYQQYTDIEAALSTAAAAEAEGWRHLVLLTDGVIDLAPGNGSKPEIDLASRARLVDSVVPALADQGVAIHAIAFSDGADVALVERLAQRTGGLAAVAETPNALLGAFLDIVERIFPVDQVPLQDQRFTVDASVDDFSALVFHEPGQGEVTLVAPDGRRYTRDTAPAGVRWQREPRFDLIQVPRPEQGEWRIEGPVADDSRVTVNSDRQLVTGALPATLYSGFSVPLSVRVEQGDDVMVPEGLQVTAELTGEAVEGSHVVSLVNQQGVFRADLAAPAGVGAARLVITAEADDFHRQRVQAVNVLPAIGVALDRQQRSVSLVAEHPRLEHGNTRFEAELTGQPLEVKPAGDRRWTLQLPELEDDVRRPMRIVAVAELDGDETRWELPTVWINADGEVGIDRALAGPTLSGERFASASDDTAAPAQQAPLADRFVALVNEGPERLVQWWRDGRPGLAPAMEQARSDPRVLASLVVVLVVCVVLYLWRRRRQRQPERESTREEPHV